MSSDTYDPVPINVEHAVTEAKTRPGFTEAWEALESEYAALSDALRKRKKAELTKE